VLRIPGAFDFGFVHQVLTVTTERARKGFDKHPVGRHENRLGQRTLSARALRSTYLSESELRHMIDGLLTRYYRRLGQEVLPEARRELLGFHRTKLAELGYPLSKPRLAAGARMVPFELPRQSEDYGPALAQFLASYAARSLG